tara:strand:+ start:1942 stop:2160 length:219 start_codon:yes stop_codon:yes gene_type:complete
MWWLVTYQVEHVIPDCDAPVPGQKLHCRVHGSRNIPDWQAAVEYVFTAAQASGGRNPELIAVEEYPNGATMH